MRGISPMIYLVCSAGMGALWFVLLVLALRLRSDLLRISSLLFLIFGQMWLTNCLSGPTRRCDMLQGGMVTAAVGTALLWSLRRPLLKFAKLDEPGHAA